MGVFFFLQFASLHASYVDVLPTGSALHYEFSGLQGRACSLCLYTFMNLTRVVFQTICDVTNLAHSPASKRQAFQQAQTKFTLSSHENSLTVLEPAHTSLYRLRQLNGQEEKHIFETGATLNISSVP